MMHKGAGDAGDDARGCRRLIPKGCRRMQEMHKDVADDARGCRRCRRMREMLPEVSRYL